MLVGTVNLNLFQWQASCPPTLARLKQQLSELDQQSKTLKSFLDHLIECILECDQQLERENSEAHKKFLTDRLKDFYHFVAVITDTPAFFVTPNESKRMAADKRYMLQVIKAKRRIDPTYIPNHMPGEEPDYIPPESYQAVEETDPENIDPALETKKKCLAKLEAALCQSHRRRRFAALGKGREKKELLAIQKRYYIKETLIKAIFKVAHLKLPTEKDPPKYFDLFEERFNSINNIKLSSIELNAMIIKELQLELELSRKRYEEIVAMYDQYDEQAQLYMGPAAIKKTYLRLDAILKSYERLHPDNKALKSIRAELSSVLGPICPILLASYHDFRIKHPTLFEKEPLVRYFSQEEREEFRVHLFKGKCHRFVQENRRIKIKLFNSTTEKSHLKEGWVSFIMNSRGEIFASSHGAYGRNNKRERIGIFHSSFMSGAPVIFAGEMKVDKNGKIIAVSNYSGHYEPKLNNLFIIARHLHKRGVDLSSCIFHEINDEIKNDKLSEVDQSQHLTKEEKRGVKKNIDDDSERLKFSNRYHFKDGNFVAVHDFNYKKALMIGGLVILTLLSLVALGLVIAATQGAAIPVLAPLLAKFVTVAGASIAYGVSVMVAGIAPLIPAVIGLKIAGGFNAISSGLKSIKNWFGNIFSKNITPGHPNEPINDNTREAHFTPRPQGGKSTGFIHGVTNQAPVNSRKNNPPAGLDTRNDDHKGTPAVKKGAIVQPTVNKSHYDNIGKERGIEHDEISNTSGSIHSQVN